MKIKLQKTILFLALIGFVGLVIYDLEMNRQREEAKKNNDPLVQILQEQLEDKLNHKKEPEIVNEDIVDEVFCDLVSKTGDTIESRIGTPKGFKRVKVDGDSFGEYLRSFKLREADTKVKYYNGDIKPYDVYVAVLDLSLDNKDLQQCADSIIRLRAEYLYSLKRYDEINFKLTNGFETPYSKWIEGYRVSVEGNKTKWTKKTDASNDRDTFNKYLNFIFTYAGTISLDNELKTVEYSDMKIGDIFIKGGSPGHAVIVMDMAVNDEGEKLFLLAQGYMPAQDMHVLKNPVQQRISPWYKSKHNSQVITPEWEFCSEDLKRFE